MHIAKMSIVFHWPVFRQTLLPHKSSPLTTFCWDLNIVRSRRVAVFERPSFSNVLLHISFSGFLKITTSYKKEIVPLFGHLYCTFRNKFI